MPTSPPIRTTVRIALTTAANPEQARSLADTLVREQLAACATLIPAVESIYQWEGKIENSTETLLLLKTTQEQLSALEARLHSLHSYDVPEFLVLDVDAASHPYFDWMLSCLSKPPTSS